MKLAFSTIGCPGVSWQDMTAMAKDFGFHGIELRENEDNPINELLRALGNLKTGKLEIACISTGSCMQCSDTQREHSIAESKEIIGLAGKLGTRYIRILADRTACGCNPLADDQVITAIRAILPAAEEAGVTLLVETNGVFSDTKLLAGYLAELASDHVGALWDLHHPYRLANESPAETVSNLGAYIKYVHCKDSVMESGKPIYQLMGEGDMPFEQFFQALRSINYDGWLSLEWAKGYFPEMEEYGVVFPHYVNFMNAFLPECEADHRLYDNARGTGKYIWPKEHLIDLTFPQLLDKVADEFPDQYAFRYTVLDYFRTYKEFRDEVDVFARSLIAMGVRPGDHVAIWATNVPQWFLTFWAAVKIGAVLVTVNTSYKIHEAEYLLRQSDTHTLVMVEGFKDSDYAGIMRKLCPELDAGHLKGQRLYSKRLPFLRNIITVDFELPGCYRFDEAMALAEQVPIEEVQRRAMNCRKDDVCNMQYTSGTTGFPKGVMLTHYNIINNGKTIGDGMDFSTADKLLIHVPMFHCFGMVLAMTASMTHGATMVPIPAYSPKLALEAINKEQITACHGVPTMFIAMLGHEDFDQTDFSSMRTGIMAGSPCPVKVMEDVLTKMNMSEITIVFGQTESSPGCTMSLTTDSIDVRVSTVGRAFFGVECKIVDPETNQDLPDNVDGEFVARGYNIMKGYYKMPEATAAAIDTDGWLHTGDLARRDADGNYKITGRIKDMIIRGGENIYPKEIEDFIYTHPKVSDVQVIGVPSRAYGEEIMAWIILKPGEESTEAEIKQFVLDHMAKHKVPSYVHFTDGFPMNAAGKIMKYKMREASVELLGLHSESKIVTA